MWIDGCQNTTSNILKLESLYSGTSSKRGKSVRSGTHSGTHSESFNIKRLYMSKT